MVNKSTVKKYCCRNFIKGMLMSMVIAFQLALIVLAIAGFIFDVIIKAESFAPVMVLFIIVFVVSTLMVNNLWTNSQYRTFERKWNKLEKLNLIPTVLNDFSAGARCFGDQLIIGSICMIGKETGSVLLFDEISSIDYHVGSAAPSYDNSGGEPTSISAVVNGKKQLLCHPYNDQHLQDAFAVGQKFNDQVQSRINERNNFLQFMQSKGISVTTNAV